MADTVQLGPDTCFYLKLHEVDQPDQYLVAFDRGTTRRYNWPKLASDGKRAALKLIKMEGSNLLKSGDAVKIQTTESAAGDQNTLGAFKDSRSCYYWKDGYSDEQQGWIITKLNGAQGEPICYGDVLSITNIYYRHQQLAADITYSRDYITTRRGAGSHWVLEKVPEVAPIGENEYEWHQYYEAFDYFSADAIRPGCHPRIMEHPELQPKAVVLVHGLTDSPYFMGAIAKYFFEQLHYDVYIPLLEGHGLKEPQGMEGIKLENWHQNVSFAVNKAAAGGREVSIGGLSTGGALSFFEAAKNDAVNGALYLFSAALDLAGDMGIGNIKEVLVRSFLSDVLDDDEPLVGSNPYRYGRMDYDGARELSRLIKEIDGLIASLGPLNLFSKPVFAAHSESDATADIGGIETLQRVCSGDQFRFFRLRKDDNVGHAELVLNAHVRDEHGNELEKPNPKFGQMMEAMRYFEAAVAHRPVKPGELQLQTLRDFSDHLDDVEMLLAYHRNIVSERDALARYATAALAAYLDEDLAIKQLQPLGCELLEASVRADSWGTDGLRAMCIQYGAGETQEMIVAFRGTDTSNPADLITDGGVVSAMISGIGDEIVRAVVARGVGQTTWKNALSTTLTGRTLAAQIGGRLVNAIQYYQEQARPQQLDFNQYSKITVVGHSLGGLIAAHVAYWANRDQAPVYCHTFNTAPGVKYTLVASPDQCDRTIASRIINHRIIGDSVSYAPAPIGGDSQGFPYGHMGFIYNWRPLTADTLTSIAVHSLERFIDDLQFDTQHLAGVASAPVSDVYW